MEEIMKSLRISMLSLALLLPIATVASEEGAAKAGYNIGQKVGQAVGAVRAKLPAMPTKEQAKEAVINAPKLAAAYAKEHPYKAAAIVATTAAVAYVVYKVCTAKKAEKTKVVIVK